MADTVILGLAIGLGLHQKIGIGRFVPVYLGVTNVLPILLTLFLHADRLEEFKQHAPMFSKRHSQEDDYDFIIVGGGAGGCVVANRLSRHFKVLLLERGGSPNPLTYTPALDTTLLSRPQLDYTFRTVPQKNSCLSCNDRVAIWNQGLGLGGSGMINSMVYLRGHPYDYDYWAYFTNDKRWKYKNVLPYFLRSENYCYECEKWQTILTPTNVKYHSTGGELPLMKPHNVPLLYEFLQGMEWANIDIQDQNAPFFYSAANVAVYNQRFSRRSSAYTSFLEPILESRKENLKIWKYTRVIKILFHPNSNKAYGVQFERFGKLGTVTASKEIILSAGAISTPKILLNSGIGPADHLRDLEIPCRLNLPVGKNLQDHFGTLVGPILIDKPLSFIYERDVSYQSVIQFLYNGTGPLTLPFPVANAFWSSSRAIKDGESEWPDVQVGFSPSGVGQGVIDGLVRGSNIRRDIITRFLNPVLNKDGFFLIVDYGRPKTRGTVTLASKDWMDDPRIDPNYYEDSKKEDISVTVEALQRALYIAENAPAFKKLGARLSPVPFPSCQHVKFRSDQYWECVARHFTLSFHHHAGTCTMGPLDSKHSVVDSELRVIGAKRLRVIDSSIMPFVTSFNTHAPTIMIGERGADFVLEYWKNKIATKSTKFMFEKYNKHQHYHAHDIEDSSSSSSNEKGLKSDTPIMSAPGAPTLKPTGKDNYTLGWGTPIDWFKIKRVPKKWFEFEHYYKKYYNT